MPIDWKNLPTKSYKQLIYDLKIKFNDISFISRNSQERLTIGILSFDLHQSTIKFFLIALKLFLLKFSISLIICRQTDDEAIKTVFSKNKTSRKAKNFGKMLESRAFSKKMQRRAEQGTREKCNQRQRREKWKLRKSGKSVAILPRLRTWGLSKGQTQPIITGHHRGWATVEHVLIFHLVGHVNQYRLSRTNHRCQF